MKTSALLEEIRDVVAADENVAAYCVETFGKAGSVWLGVDEDNPVPEEDYPCVAILEAAPAIASGTHDRWMVVIGVGVVSDQVDSLENKRTYTGILQAENLRELVEAAVMSAGIGKVSLAGETARISQYPKFVSFTTITIEKIRSKRRL